MIAAMRHALAVAALAALAAMLAEAAVPAAAAGASLTYVVDPAASRMEIFVGKAGSLKAFGHVHHVFATQMAGEVVVDPSEPAGGRVRLVFPSAGLTVDPSTEPAKDLAAVQSDMETQVLAREQHPEITFTSTSIRPSQRAAASAPEPAKKPGKSSPPTMPSLGGIPLVVAGDLTLRGTTRPLEIPVDAVISSDSVHVVGQARLRQTDFGITPPSAAGGRVRAADELVLTFDLTASAQDRSR
jgi:polyisoprenoid-binding protein YceI